MQEKHLPFFLDETPHFDCSNNSLSRIKGAQGHGKTQNEIKPGNTLFPL